MSNKTPNHSSRIWTAGSVAKILKEEAYVGRYIWGRKKRILNPSTGKYRWLDVPEKEWIVKHMPHLVVIDNATFQKAKDSFKAYSKSNDADRFKKKQHAPHFLSKIAYCGSCGGTYPVLYSRTRASGGISGYYGCRRRHVDRFQGCSNMIKIPVELLDSQIKQAIITRYGSSEFSRAIADDTRKVLDEFLATTFSQDARQKLIHTISSHENEKRDLEAMIATGKFPGTGLKSLSDIDARIADLRELETLPICDYLPKIEDIVTAEEISGYYRILIQRLNEPEAAGIALSALIERINIRPSADGAEVELIECVDGIIKHMLFVISKWIPHTRYPLGTLLAPCMRRSFAIQLEWPAARQTDFRIGEDWRDRPFLE